MNTILVIDVGTSSMRGVLYDTYGKTYKKVQHHYRPKYLDNIKVEQNPLDWKKTLIEIISEMVSWTKQEDIKIEAISITAQRTSIIPVDQEGRPLRDAIMWQDKRSITVCEQLEVHSEFVYQRTGSKINPVFTAPKIKWLRENEPEIYDQAHKIIVIPDYLIFIMTGKFVTDYTYGSRTSLMNIETMEWDEELINLFQVDREKLCQLVPQGSIVGYTSDRFNQKIGLRTSIPVISAGGDQQCAALGAGTIEDGSVQVTSGTGSFIIASSDRLQLDPEMRILCSVSAVPHKYILEASVLTTSTIISWFASNFFADDNGRSAIEILLDHAEKSPVGSKNLITFPHFQGRGSPDWNAMAKGMFFNVSLETDKGDFARSILESIAFEVYENMEIIHGLLGEIVSIGIAGGLTRSVLFNQIQADIYHQKVSLPENEETTSLGAWISATVSLGNYVSHREALSHAEKGTKQTIFYPLKENGDIYEPLKILRKELYRRMKESDIYQLVEDEKS